MKINKTIPTYVIDWTDRYFHQSAFDVPLSYPSKKTRVFLSKFRPTKPITLFRGINRYNKDNRGITSWSYSKRVAERYAKEIEGYVIQQKIHPNQILLDTANLTKEEKYLLGYDYKIDDNEVLIFQT